MTHERDDFDHNDTASTLAASEGASLSMYNEAIRDYLQGASNSSSSQTGDTGTASTIRIGRDALASIPSQLDFGVDSLYGQTARTPYLNGDSSQATSVSAELAAKQAAQAKEQRVHQANQTGEASGTDAVAAKQAAADKEQRVREAAQSAGSANAESGRINKIEEPKMFKKPVKDEGQHAESSEQKPLKKPGLSAEAAGKKPLEGKDSIDKLPLDSKEKLNLLDKELNPSTEQKPGKKPIEYDSQKQMEYESKKPTESGKDVNADLNQLRMMKEKMLEKLQGGAKDLKEGAKDLSKDDLAAQIEQKIKQNKLRDFEEATKPGQGKPNSDIELKPLKFPAGGKESTEQDAPKKPVATPGQGEMGYGQAGDAPKKPVAAGVEAADAGAANAAVGAAWNDYVLGKNESVTLRETQDGNFSHTTGDGTRITVRPDGVTTVESDGARYKVAPDGTMSVTRNGVEQQFDPSSANRDSGIVGGTRTLHYGESMVVTKPDGGLVISQPSGRTVETFGSTPKRVNYVSRLHDGVK